MCAWVRGNPLRSWETYHWPYPKKNVFSSPVAIYCQHSSVGGGAWRAPLPTASVFGCLGLVWILCKYSRHEFPSMIAMCCQEGTHSTSLHPASPVSTSFSEMFPEPCPPCFYDRLLQGTCNINVARLAGRRTSGVCPPLPLQH